MPADLQAQNEAFDSEGAILQKVKAAMSQKAKAIYDLADADADRAKLIVWADDIYKNPNAISKELDQVRRYVFAYHAATEADKAALLGLSDTKVQTAVDAYVDNRYNPA